MPCRNIIYSQCAEANIESEKKTRLSISTLQIIIKIFIMLFGCTKRPLFRFYIALLTMHTFKGNLIRQQNRICMSFLCYK